MENKLEQIFKKDRQILVNWINKNYPQYLNKEIHFKIVKKHIDELTSLISEFDQKIFRTYLKYLNFLNLNKQLKKCKNCGKYLPYDYLSGKKSHDYCSIKCSMPDKLKVIEQTNLQKYGVKNAFQAECFKNKIKQTLIERYHVDSPIKNKEIYEKIKQTNIEKYRR